MSGGEFDYAQEKLFYRLMPYEASINYGLGDNKEYQESINAVRKSNPMKNRMISELVYDVLCLVHSLDWYVSGDTSQDTYEKDVEFFKKKWLKNLDNSYIKELVETQCDNLKTELLKELADGND